MLRNLNLIETQIRAQFDRPKVVKREHLVKNAHSKIRNEPDPERRRRRYNLTIAERTATYGYHYVLYYKKIQFIWKMRKKGMTDEDV